MIELLIFIPIVLFLNSIFKKKNFLPNYSGQPHQLLFTQKKIQLTGGFFALLVIIYIFRDNYNFQALSIAIFLIGLTSDKNYLVSPQKRLFIQIFYVILFVIFLDLKISTSRIDFFDLYLNNYIFSIMFTSFCILVLINGCNFIDGLNGLLLTYFLIILIAINKIGLLDSIITNHNEAIFIFLSFFFILLLNFSNNLFMGDNGSYLIGVLLSYILIYTYNVNNLSISPYYIILLLWYPCFENLFSIIRKFKKKISPIDADNKHLHQLLYLYLHKRLKIKKNFINPLSGIVINLFNLIIIYYGSTMPNNTKYQLILIIISMIIYMLTYRFLSTQNLLFKKK